LTNFIWADNVKQGNICTLD